MNIVRMVASGAREFILSNFFVSDVCNAVYPVRDFFATKYPELDECYIKEKCRFESQSLLNLQRAVENIDNDFYGALG
jgi:hypothetical protein